MKYRRAFTCRSPWPSWRICAQDDLRPRQPASVYRCDDHFAEDYPQAKRYLLYRGDDRLKRDGVLCLPAEQFLAELKPNQFPK
jgi:hypothetical protein